MAAFGVALLCALPFIIFIIIYIASGAEKRRWQRIQQEAAAQAQTYSAARSPGTSVEKLRQLAASNDPKVIEALLANPSTPPELHAALVVKQSSLTRRTGFGYGVIFGPGGE